MHLEISMVTNQQGKQRLSPTKGCRGLTSGRTRSAGARPAGWQEPAVETPLGHSLVIDPDGKELPRPGQAHRLPHV